LFLDKLFEKILIFASLPFDPLAIVLKDGFVSIHSND